MTSVRIIDVAAPPSERLLCACAAFGLAVRYQPAQPRAGAPRRAADARGILRSLHPGQLALITGPSGGGKSSLLHDIADAARAQHEQVLELPPPSTDPDTPIIDLLDLPLAESLGTLARAGLADATMLGRAPTQLSDGERFRLRLALAMSTCRAPVTLLIDEFASTLDRTTARCLCRALRRWQPRQQAEGRAIRIIAATAHHDIAEWLEPDLIAVVPLGGAPVELSAQIARSHPPALRRPRRSPRPSPPASRDTQAA
jgi:ABC-type ATPase with predicted acetyltransferase domain